MSSLKFRILKAIGDRGWWKYVSPVHIWIYRTSGGRLGHSAGGISNLVLTAQGRRSGEARAVALTYFQDGDNWILIASNGGRPQHPAWWLNLVQQPQASIQVGADTFAVVASEATGAERQRLWQAAVRYNPMYGEYEKMTKRQIPVVVLTKR